MSIYLRIARAVAWCVLAAVALSTPVAAQEPATCLDNSGVRSVPAGNAYDDAVHTWICAPGRPGASAGGWVETPRQVPAVPTPASGTGPVEQSPTSPPDRSLWTSPLSWALGAVLVGLIASVVVADVRRRAPRLYGQLVVFDKQRSTRVDLSAYQRSATVGTSGRLRVAGEGILPEHLELRAEADGRGAVDVVVRPKQGSVSLLRGKHIVHVAIGTPLRDRDEIILGPARLQYRNLAAGISKLAG